MILILGIALASVIYLIGVGVVFIRTGRRLADKCQNCDGKITSGECGHDILAVFFALTWPALIFVVIPAIWADPHRGKLREEKLQRRINELETGLGIK